MSRNLNPNPYTTGGLPIHTRQDFPSDANYFVKSFDLTATAQAWNIWDIGVVNDLVGATGTCFLKGGRYRTYDNSTAGSELHFQIVDRDDVLGYSSAFGLSRGKLKSLTSEVGTFQVGEIITGGTSGCRSSVLAVNASELEICHHRWDKDDDKLSNFADGETITGATSGATAVLGTPAFTEGDTIVAQSMVKDEGMRGIVAESFIPGGAELLPQGMYFRIKVWNNHGTDGLDMKVTLEVAVK